MTYMLVFAAAFLGGMTASYLGVVAERGFKASIGGRSYCSCGKQIPAWWNIPVVSWLALRGRAQCCHCKLPARYFVTEAVMALVCGVAAAWAGALAAAVCAALTGAVVLRVSRHLARAVS